MRSESLWPGTCARVLGTSHYAILGKAVLGACSAGAKAMRAGTGGPIL